MKQFTKKQAIAFHDSGQWKDFTHEEIVRLQLFQTRLCVPFDRFHEAVEKVLGRPVFTHELGNLKRLRQEYLKEREAPTLEEIINLIPEEKRIILTVNK